jgi:hypothetical protein
MKNFSLPRLAFVLWFFFISFISVINYVFSTGRHGILDTIIYSACMVIVSLVCLGFIEDMA